MQVMKTSISGSVTDYGRCTCAQCREPDISAGKQSTVTVCTQVTAPEAESQRSSVYIKVPLLFARRPSKFSTPLMFLVAYCRPIQWAAWTPNQTPGPPQPQRATIPVAKALTTLGCTNVL